MELQPDTETHRLFRKLGPGWRRERIRTVPKVGRYVRFADFVLTKSFGVLTAKTEVDHGRCVHARSPYG